MNKFVISAVALAVTSVGGWWVSRPGAPAGPAGQTSAARRCDFSIAITEQGSFAAKDSVKMQFRPEVFHEQPTIVQVVEAGALVRKGDLLMEFDAAPLLRLLSQAEIDMQAGSNDLVQATQDMRILEENNRLNLEKAKLDLDYDRRNLKKWLDLEGPRQLEEQEARVQELENLLAEAEANLQALQKMKEEDLVSEAEVRKARLAMEKAARDLGFTRSALKLMKEYDQPLRLKTLEDTVQKSLSLLNGIEAAQQSLIAQKQSAVLRAENALAQKQDHLAKVKRDQERLKLIAPVDGMLLYGDPNNRWYGDNMKIAVGEKVHAHHPLMTIPDLSSFTVKVAIGEADINKIKPGLQASVKPDALSDVTFQASVKSVSTVVSQDQWWAPDANGKFEVVLDLKDCDARIKPGMKCKVEVAVENVKDALVVPVDAVFDKEGKTFCHVLRNGRAVEQAVKAGRSNADLVEILEGIAEGDVVALYDPNKE